MKKYAVVWKNVGETPLAALMRLKGKEGITAPACYAGRLDPMAEGKLLILFGEECKRLSDYAKRDKEYDIDVLLDMGSDTGDALGLPVYAHKETQVDQATLRALLRNEEGEHERAYPAFSSKTVSGKPLFLHTLEGSEVEAPTHREHIYRIQVKSVTHIGAQALRTRVFEHLSHAPRTTEPSKALGKDFRQDEIRKAWEKLFDGVPERTFTLLSLRVSCGSGTYMRTLAGRIGEGLHTQALALSITRRKIGKYWKGFWLTSY